MCSTPPTQCGRSSKAASCKKRWSGARALCTGREGRETRRSAHRGRVDLHSEVTSAKADPRGHRKVVGRIPFVGRIPENLRAQDFCFRLDEDVIDLLTFRVPELE